MKPTRAFTLIEILVVVAIIGILATIVLASLIGSKSQGTDTALKADLSDAQTQASNYFDIGSTYCEQSNNACITFNGSGSYSTSCTNAGTLFNDDSTSIDDSIGVAITSAVKDEGGASANVICQIKSTAYLIAGKLSTGSWWCVDSTGAATPEGSKPTSGKTACP